MIKTIIQKAFKNLGYEIKRVRYDDKALYESLFEKADTQERKFYNIGAGTFNHPFWTNIDYYSEWYKENMIGINYDLLGMRPLPIETGTANIVYSSHTIEHITDEAAQNMFNESFRILKKVA